MLVKLQSLLESKLFETAIILAIILNAITLGLETVSPIMERYSDILKIIDISFLSLFTAEIIAKLVVYRLHFFKNGWNNFDFVIVGVSLLPFIEGLSVLRSLRVLRVLRLMSVVPEFRKVTQAFFDSLSGLAAIGAIIGIIFYVGAVMTTKLFGEQFPDWFGSIGTSLYTLFQVMTLESWSMGIVRPVMEVYPYAWTFFVPFILLTTFAALNLLIGVIVNSMQTLHDASTENISNKLSAQDQERAALREKIDLMEHALRDLKKKL